MKSDVKIIRSRRKSFSLSVSPENEIVLRCPENVPDSRIKSFLKDKKSWLDKVTARNEIRLSTDKAVIEYKEIYVGGVKLPLIVSDKNDITENAVFVKSLKQIKRLFISGFSAKFISFAREISENTGLKANGISVRSYKRRWGCCDSKGIITFNWLLFMLPYKLRRYVIIHELCHIVCFNHSADFWKLVSAFEPDYKNLRRQLKDYDYITNLY